MNVNLKLLHRFVLVAEARSFRAAAREAGRTEPAISMQVRQLEDQLGVSLFTRTSRSVRLTSEGKILFGSAKQALADIAEALETLSGLSALQKNRAVLGVSQSVASAYLPVLLLEFRLRHPLISVHANEMNAHQFAEPLKGGAVDFALGLQVEADPDLLFEPLRAEEMVALMPLSAKDDYSQGIELGELLSFPLILSRSPNVVRNALEQECAERGATLEPTYEMSQFNTIVALVSAGLGVTICPRTAVAAIQSSHLLVAPVHSPTFRSVIGVFTARGRRLPAAAEKLKDLASAIISNVPPDGAVQGWTSSKRAK